MGFDPPFNQNRKENFSEFGTGAIKRGKSFSGFNHAKQGDKTGLHRGVKQKKNTLPVTGRAGGPGRRPKNPRGEYAVLRHKGGTSNYTPPFLQNRGKKNKKRSNRTVLTSRQHRSRRAVNSRPHLPYVGNQVSLREGGGHGVHPLT